MCQELHSLIKECLDSIVASLFETNELTNSVLVSDDRIQISLLILGRGTLSKNVKILKDALTSSTIRSQQLYLRILLSPISETD